jgi:single-stranded-DNA-specific exonuclease
MSEPRIVTRPVPEPALRALIDSGVPVALARVFAARGIDGPGRLDTALGSLFPVESLHNCEVAARLLADAIGRQEKLLIVADYDADGATSCALAMSVLRTLGADVEYLVPNRFEYGYGLTPEIVQLAVQRRPNWLVTVDNGISSVEGVELAARLGIRVLITDHHLPGDRLPDAACIVNPNQPGCAFPSKHLAGVGVMFYVLLALRAELRNRGHFRGSCEPNLADVLDLVALGTVADVARLDDNNRILIAQGLRRIRADRARPGINALFRVAGRNPARASTYDLAFVLGPRLNAAGRLDDMSVGIECLLAPDDARAAELADTLDRLNRERREIEAQMQDSALEIIERLEVPDRYSLTLYDQGWHQGVIGVLASRLKERFHRPVFAFAPGPGGEAKGSGRSVPGLHLRDAVDLVAKRHPGLVRRFGGHAAAAGVAVGADDIGAFADAFESVVRSLLQPADLEQVIETDGPLGTAHLSLELAEAIEAQVWGQGFAAPLFCDEFEVIDQRIVGGRHSRLMLRQPGATGTIVAMRFGEDIRLPSRVRTVYRLQVNEFNGARTPQLVIERWVAVQ